jgi:hypothetical protein
MSLVDVGETRFAVLATAGAELERDENKFKVTDIICSPLAV